MGQPSSTTLTNAFSNAVYNGRGGLGSVVVIAALNTYQASVTYPGKLAAILPGMITVGASTWCDTIKAPNPPGDCSGETWWGNNWGTEVVVTAPGHSIYSPDLTGTDGYTSADYSYFNGTSAATPIVAGVAGLLLSQNPGWTNDQVRDRIAMTADAIYTAGYDIASGWGRVNAQKALSATITNTGRQDDHIADAQTINEVPAQISEAVTGAFRDRTDPTLTCLSSSQSYSSSLWFKFVPPYTMSATITTSGSTYNTVLAIYDSAMTSLACNNDTGGIQSQVVVNLNGGAAYYVLVGGYSTVSSPTGVADAVNLVLNITTATAAPGPLLTGTVTFQGRPPAPDADLSLPLHVLVKPTGGGVAVFDGSVSTNNFGAFALNLPANTYDVWVKGERTLARLVTVDLSTNMSIDVGTLQEGDANGDNIVNIQDFSLLASAFGTQEGDAAYDVRADFNADGLVNIGDFSLLAASFAQVGAPAP
ncbi:MAG: S8 family serine peptidase [Chloroflexi bacterium]|nr:S8 family serine peptidase [Chloroflexota bacterium]